MQGFKEAEVDHWVDQGANISVNLKGAMLKMQCFLIITEVMILQK